MGFFSKLFGGSSVDYKALVTEQKAKVIDVRTPAEFKGGHIRGSVNIPLQNIKTGAKKYNKEDTIIVCCASGMRSGQAKRVLNALGYSNVHNGGGWAGLNQKLK